MKARTLSLGILAICGILTRCSVEVVDGGTHTGNPDITACASALYQLLDSDSSWRIEAYISATQLDPATLIPPANAIPGLAKTASTSPDSSPAYFEKIVLVPDTNYINDTFVRDTIIHTSMHTIIGNDTQSFVVDSLHRDSIIVIDTIIKLDTVIIKDSLPFISQSPENRLNDTTLSIVIHVAPKYDAITYHPGDTAPVINFTDAETNSRTSYPVSAGNYSIASLQSVASLSKTYHDQYATAITITYSDDDGDQRLLQATPGTIPRALVVESRTNGSTTEILKARFDAGVDTSFSTTTDNMVHSLAHYTIIDQDTTLSTIYNRDLPESTRHNAMHIQRKESSPNPNIFYRETHYSIFPDNATGSSSNDSLNQTIVYSRDPVARIVLSISPALRSAPLGPHSFKATITLLDGQTTTLVGTVDSVTGISAEYSAHGATQHVAVDKEGEIAIE
jgi:hypothetical protein